MLSQENAPFTPDYAHCLRKQFTHSIYAKLKEGNSINLIGEKGSGRQRLLEDISSLAQQEGITPVLVNMNRWKHHFKGFVEHVYEQLYHARELPAGEGQSDTTQSTDLVPTDHLSLMLAGQLMHHRQIFLLINNYDYILNNPKQRFPKSFFDDLNSLRSKTHLSLCLVTQQSHLQSKVFYKDPDGTMLKNSLSWLDLDILEIPRLTLAEVREELNKKINHLHLWEAEQEQERFVTAVQDHQSCYDFLEIIVNSFQTDLAYIPAERRLKRCYRHYGQHYRRQKGSSRISWESLKDLVDWAIEKYAKIKGK